MKLNEVFNTKPDVNWSSTASGFIGKFTLEGEEYEILMDELEIELGKTFSIIDVGFTKSGSYDLSGSKVNSTKVFGAVLNGIIPKIKEINPDAIMFGMNNKNGNVEERKKLYERIAKMYSKGSSHTHMTQWIKTKNGQYMAITKVALTADEMQKITDLADSIPLKS